MRRSWLPVVLLLAVAPLGGCGYNTIQTYDEQINVAQAQIETQLKRRADLVPNLVETVKGYAAHERSTLEAVTDGGGGVCSRAVSGAATVPAAMRDASECAAGVSSASAPA